MVVSDGESQQLERLANCSRSSRPSGQGAGVSKVQEFKEGGSEAQPDPPIASLFWRSLPRWGDRPSSQMTTHLLRIALLCSAQQQTVDSPSTRARWVTIEASSFPALLRGVQACVVSLLRFQVCWSCHLLFRPLPKTAINFLRKRLWILLMRDLNRACRSARTANG